MSKELVVNILKYIDENINSKIVIDDLVSQFNYNRFYIMKIFKKELNVSIIDYINILKVYRSLNYLKEKHSLLTIALRNGFYSLEYYSEMFKKIIGINPITYRKIINHDHVDENKINIYISNLSKIKEIINMAEKYKYNKVPAIIKKLTIFKQKAL